MDNTNEHRIFKIKRDDNNRMIIYIPSLFEVSEASSSMADLIPNFVLNVAPHPVSRWENLPDYIFSGANLILTDHCNLSCTYCYADTIGKREKFTMSERIAQSAIDYIADCAKKSRKSRRLPAGLIYINILGGEPTQAWKVMTSAVQYLRKKAEEIDYKSKTTISTNGCITLEQTRWLAENFDKINISFDGYQDVHNSHRSNSFSQVLETANMIYKRAPEKLTIRSTVSKYSADNFSQIVNFFCENFSGCKLIFEPIFTIGGRQDGGHKPPSDKVFFQKFIESLPVAERYGSKLETSILNLGGGHEFCGVASHNFVITPKGDVTACNRMTDPDNKIANRFIYGKFNKENNSFDFDNEKYQQLKEFNFDNIEECKDCFALTSCGAGGCVVNRTETDKNRRCEGIKNFIKEVLIYMLDRDKEKHIKNQK